MRALKTEAAKPSTDTLLRPSWIEVDLGAVAHNFRELRRLVGPDVLVIAALKRNGYGMGAVAVARVLKAEGAYGFAVANAYDAVRLRDGGIEAPILLYAGTGLDAAPEVVRRGFIPSISTPEDVEAYAKAAEAAALDGFEVFLKVDVGLSRAGVPAEQAADLARRIVRARPLKLAGAYTHIHMVPNADGYAEWQYARMRGLFEALAKDGIEVPIRIAAHTPVILTHPGMEMNAVDPGHLLFGIQLVERPAKPVQLRPALKSFKARLLLAKTLPPRERFAEHGPPLARADGLLGLIPVGWGDGLPSALPPDARALVRGRPVRFLDRVAMEHCRLDLTDMPEARAGDEVVLIGRQGEREISPETAAGWWGRSLSQLYAGMRDHIPRVYLPPT